MNFLEKSLGFDPKTMTVRTELIAGATTFLTMSYILAVNPAVLSSTGMDKGALFTGTALAAAIATTKPSGDGSYVWDRLKSGEDISPLMAMTMAFGLATQVEEEEPPKVSAYADGHDLIML